jgi:hypothetical protein
MDQYMGRVADKAAGAALCASNESDMLLAGMLLD